MLALISLAFPLVTLLALSAVWSAVSKARESSAVTGLLWLALLAAILTGAVRILLMYQFNWTLAAAGTYADISTLWYAVLLGEFIGVGLWLLSLVMGNVRGTDPLGSSHARTRRLVKHRHRNASKHRWRPHLGAVAANCRRQSRHDR